MGSSRAVRQADETKVPLSQLCPNSQILYSQILCMYTDTKKPGQLGWAMIAGFRAVVVEATTP